LEFTTGKNEIVIKLPITTPTGKIRVKRLFPDCESDPVACVSNAIEQNDYLEWQISYDTETLQEDSVLEEVILQKPDGVRYGCELIRLLVEGRKCNLILDKEFEELMRFVDSKMDIGIEENERIKRVRQDTENIAQQLGYVRYTLNVPDYLLDKGNYSIEIKIMHKQRAVGNQSMVFVNVPIKQCRTLNGQSLVGRRAESKELVEWVIGKKNYGVIIDTIKAFCIASLRHKHDIQEIFKCLK
jgi:hypothetical protein